MHRHYYNQNAYTLVSYSALNLSLPLIFSNSSRHEIMSFIAIGHAHTLSKLKIVLCAEYNDLKAVLFEKLCKLCVCINLLSLRFK